MTITTGHIKWVIRFISPTALQHAGLHFGCCCCLCLFFPTSLPLCKFRALTLFCEGRASQYPGMVTEGGAQDSFGSKLSHIRDSAVLLCWGATGCGQGRRRCGALPPSVGTALICASASQFPSHVGSGCLHGCVQDHLCFLTPYPGWPSYSPGEEDMGSASPSSSY